jgi:quercetin dioxygenase-like cupin family protein
LLSFDLAAEAAQVQLERGFREGDRNANTLMKATGFSVVLTALRAGTHLQEHQAADWVTVQTLQGRLKLRALDQEVELPSGHLLVLEPKLRHSVEALEDTAFLITLAGAGHDEA